MKQTTCFHKVKMLKIIAKVSSFLKTSPVLMTGSDRCCKLLLSNSTKRWTPPYLHQFPCDIHVTTGRIDPWCFIFNLVTDTTEQREATARVSYSLGYINIYYVGHPGQGGGGEGGFFKVLKITLFPKIVRDALSTACSCWKESGSDISGCSNLCN